MEKTIRDSSQFAEYLPQLFLDSVTDGGNIGYRASNIGPVPRGSSGSDMAGLVYAGHLLSFNARDERTIVTSIALNRSAPLKRINPHSLRAYLQNPTVMGEAGPRKPSAADIFAPATYDSTNLEVALTLVEGIHEFTGRTTDLWKGFDYHVATPLKRALWPL